MKICDSWLREWVEHDLAAEALAERLTMLGLEVESVVPVGAPVTPLLVGRVTELQRHPNADKLSLCRVDVGSGALLEIVCGARNVREGGLYPTALEGARLPGGVVIKMTVIRGQRSAGMLCSAAELGLESAADGLIELDSDAMPGDDASALLQLGDWVLDISLTPNRADCFSIAGIAREIGAATGNAVRSRDQAAVPSAISDTFPVSVVNPADCPRFAGRVIRGLRQDARTPLWMQERLRRCGVRPLHPVVDVTNYVMLELGQPMHAYDLARLRGGIDVRRGGPSERLRLLDGREVATTPDLLVIAHQDGAIGLAGIMGGAATAVTAGTRDLFLESAFFAPAALAGRARRIGLHTDASVRFERGVDPSMQTAALELASRLVLQIAGGSPGPITDVASARNQPQRCAVRLRRARIARVLGASMPDEQVESILGRLGFTATTNVDGWTVTPPAARFDIEREEDLIEEVARVRGYEQIAPVAGCMDVHPGPAAEMVQPLATIADTLVARGYQEAITYTFIEPGISRRFGADDSPQLTLSNPISSDLRVMRQSLWPGLLHAARNNLHRQQSRVRMFEIGTRFLPAVSDEHREEITIAGVLMGTRLPEQWATPSHQVDLFDAKGDVESLLELAGVTDVAFIGASHPALHPGRSARVDAAGTEIGWVGELHPLLCRELDVPAAVLFELQASTLLCKPPRYVSALSRFPSVRRDVAVVVSHEIPVEALLATVRSAAPATLREAFVFDIYSGPQIAQTEKSVAIGLILQDTSRTLTDADADGILQVIRHALCREWQAKIRE